MHIAILGVITLTVGMLIGTVGVGGILLIPALGALAQLSTHTAMGTALFSFIFTGILGTILYQRRGSIDWEVTAPLCAGSLLFGYFGALVNANAPVRILNMLLAAVIMFVGIYTLRPHRTVCNEAAAVSKLSRRFRLLFIGVAVGFGSGLTGVGGPVLSVPLLIVFGFPPLTSIAASQVVQITAALSGSAGNLAHGFIDFTVVWWVTLFELAGVVLGAGIAHASSSAFLKKIVSVVCIAVGGYILMRSL
ncbi:MAG: sulfite exporter TauE/SafE family protein [Desulfovibrio sp.]|jgi:uncharacterized membrane protein YfcA|nr:sulfite exporter TauE/SafE family protein [Desulfovibrio sp.]